MRPSHRPVLVCCGVAPLRHQPTWCRLAPTSLVLWLGLGAGAKGETSVNHCDPVRILTLTRPGPPRPNRSQRVELGYETPLRHRTSVRSSHLVDSARCLARIARFRFDWGQRGSSLLSAHGKPFSHETEGSLGLVSPLGWVERDGSWSQSRPGRHRAHRLPHRNRRLAEPSGNPAGTRRCRSAGLAPRVVSFVEHRWGRQCEKAGSSAWRLVRELGVGSTPTPPRRARARLRRGRPAWQ